MNGGDAGYQNGHVRIYSWDGSVWTQRGADVDGEAVEDQSGSSVSLSSDGSVVAIGATWNSDAGPQAGHVRIYSWDGSVWTQRGADIDGEAAVNRSGFSVSLSPDGNVVAIGAPNNNDAGSDAGHVRVYLWDGSAWIQLGTDIDGEAMDDLSGYSVSVSSDGSTVAIGAYKNDGAGDRAGHVRIYSWDGSDWTQLGADIDGEAAFDSSGWSVSLSSDGRIVAIGAYGNDGAGDKAGHVRIYAWDGSIWAQRGTDIDGEAEFDRSGESVALSSDGRVVAIGATWNSDAGDHAGHVRIYSWDGSAWMRRGADIDGEAAWDLSGNSVSLSSDGNVVAIGAPGNTGAGHVRVYEFRQPNTGLLSDDVPSGLRLYQVHPNPIIGSAEILFDLSEGADVRISIFDLLGREVSLVASKFFPLGKHRVNWSPVGLARGQYYINLTTQNNSAVAPVVIVR